VAGRITSIEKSNDLSLVRIILSTLYALDLAVCGIAEIMVAEDSTGPYLEPD
jgi:hypothetical protein